MFFLLKPMYARTQESWFRAENCNSGQQLGQTFFYKTLGIISGSPDTFTLNAELYATMRIFYDTGTESFNTG